MRPNLGRHTLASALIFLLALSLAPAFVFGQSYQEDFTSTLYRDPANTTANWNTALGRLDLPIVELALIGSSNSPGKAWDARVSGSYLYLADGSAGLRVHRISDPTFPANVGSYDTAGDARSVDIQGDILYLADGSSGLRVFDISTATTPVHVGMYNTPGFAWQVDVSGDIAVVADLTSLQLVDVSDPMLPTLLGSIATPGSCKGVFVDGDYAYIADDGGGLGIYDISDPTAPTSVGTAAAVDRAQGVHVAGIHAYVTDYSDGLRVVDVSDKANPVIVGTYDTPSLAQRVFVSGDQAYVADNQSGLLALDITDPTNPVLIDSYDTTGDGFNVSVRGNFAYVADGDAGVLIIDIGDPASPCSPGLFDLGGNYHSSFIAGDIGYAADSDSRVDVFDFSDWANPTLLGSWTIPGGGHGSDVYAAGDHLFVTAQGSGPTTPKLHILDITDPTTPTLIGTVQIGGLLSDVVAAGDYAYVTSQGSLVSIDISDPTAPFIAGWYVTPGLNYGLDVQGDLVYVADGGEGLTVVDVTDPTTPTLHGSYSALTWVYDVYVDGDRAYAADDEQVVVFDVSDPSTPAFMSSLPGGNNQIAVDGAYPYIYVAGSGTGFFSVDISASLNPVLGETYSPYYCRGVRLYGEYASVAHGPLGVRIFPVHQRHLQTSMNQAQSLDLHAGGGDVIKFIMTANESADVTWEVTADGGGNWQQTSAVGLTWTVTNPGTDLRWRVTFDSPDCDPDPHVQSLQLDWRTQNPIIQSITDVPGDQGGWVRIAFVRSGYDYTTEATWPITQYFVHRRIDDMGVAAAVLDNGVSVMSADAENGLLENWPSELPLVEWKGRYFTAPEQFHKANGGDTDAAMLADVWEVVASAPALQQDDNMVLAATLADSAETLKYSAYRLSAHTTTPSVFYYSDVDSGFSVDNIAPGVPMGVAARYDASGVQLDWDPSLDDDFQYFRIYRSTDSGFVPGPADLIHSTAGTSWNDPTATPWGLYYRITTLDYVGNESGPASPQTVTAVEDPSRRAQQYALHQNRPNPFNPVTVIRFDVPAGGGEVSIRIYDVAGRHVRTLLRDFRPQGEHSITWRGRDDGGSSVASGVYYVELQAAGMKLTRKMSLVR